MNILIKRQKDILGNIQNYHVLTYAEDGFSPLDIHTRKYDLSNEVLKKFVLDSNENDSVKTMLPLCNVSVVPRRFIRSPVSSLELHNKLLEFFDLNSSNINASKFVFDFRTH